MVYEQISDFASESIKIAKVLKDAGYKVGASNLL
jgi:hypothetical protein